MRIWHQSFTVLSDVPAYEQALQERCAAIVRPGTEVVLHGLRPGTYPTNYPGSDISYSYAYFLHGNQWIANGMRARKEGFDAYAMCTTPSPNIRELRTLLDIPVVGYGEAAALVACQLGQRFGVLTFIPGMVRLYTERMREFGFAERCTGTHYIGFTFQDVLNGYTHPGPLIDRFMTNARRIIKETGSEVLTGGSMPLSVLLARHGVFRVDDVPIIDGLAVTLKMAEMMVDLKRVAGLTPSREGYFNAAPPAERVDQLLRYYRLDHLSSDPSPSDP